MSLESIIGIPMTTKLSLWRRIALVAATLSVFVLLLLMIAVVTGVRQYSYPSMHPSIDESGNNTTNSSSQSALHHRGLRRALTQVAQPNRLWGSSCSKSDIVVNQGPSAPLPSGIPTYTVEVMNVCLDGCNIGGIHLTCGWFSSARLINPRIFRRLRFDDCLVNDGKPLPNGQTISFQYANTFRYPLAVASVVC